MSNSNSKLACDTQCNNETSKNYGYDKICRPNCDSFSGNKIYNEKNNNEKIMVRNNSSKKFSPKKNNKETEENNFKKIKKR